MTTVSLTEQCAEFAALLQRIIDGTIGPEAVSFEVVETPDEGRLRIGPGPFGTPLASAGGFPFIPLRRLTDQRDPYLFLNVQFECAMDPEGHHMAVTSSTFGLWIKPTSKKARALVMVEYVRDVWPDLPSAHVHLHAQSVDLAWLQGMAGNDLGHLPDLHFPVGGRRFRPTIEEFLVFLHREGLFIDWANSNWRETIEESQRAWEDRQAKATVRRHLPTVLEYLRSLGYEIRPPTSRAGCCRAGN